MCGRFCQSRSARAYAAYLGLDSPKEDRLGRFNVAPSQAVALAIQPAGAATRLVWCTWGLVPRWARDPQTLKTRPINARIESVAERPMFRDAWRRGQRGLVPADGFYEWREENGRKQPWFIRRRDGAPLLLAALWDTWGTQPMLTCTLLVGPPNALLATLHDRMPVIIAIEDGGLWLDARLPAAEVRRLTAPVSAGALEAYPVSPRVNTADHDGPACILPLTDRQRVPPPS